MNAKKVLLIIGILIVVAIAIFLVFFSRPQKDGGEGGFSFRNYFPFGNNETGFIDDQNDISTETDTPTNETPFEENLPIPRLRKLSNEPVAGSVIFNTGTTSVVRFVEKGTGNVYEARSDSNSIQRLTNTTIPKIIRAFWLPNGSGFIAQTISQNEIIETSFVKLNKNSTSSDETLTPFSTTISKLPVGIKEITIKPDGSKIFYYTSDRGAYSRWFLANPDGTKSENIKNHPLVEWTPKWLSNNNISMQTKGSYATAGYNYLFNAQTGIIEKIGIGTFGISTNTNNSGNLSLVSFGGRNVGLFVVNNESVTSTTTKINTIAEKCAWMTKTKVPTFLCGVPVYLETGNYPDDWYKGIVSTQDYIEKFDVINDVYYKVADLTLISNEIIDVVDPSISPDDNYLIFRNKIDGFLWMLRIEE